MRRSGKSKPVVWRWQERFMQEGVEGLLRDKTRPPGKSPLPAATVQRVIDLALSPPLGETTHWTGRDLARAAGVSLAHPGGPTPAPHRIRSFKLSTDPKRGVFRSFVELQAAITRFIAEANSHPKPFVWTADPARVLAAVKQEKQTLGSIHLAECTHPWEVALNSHLSQRFTQNRSA